VVCPRILTQLVIPTLSSAARADAVDDYLQRELCTRPLRWIRRAEWADWSDGIFREWNMWVHSADAIARNTFAFVTFRLEEKILLPW